MIQQKIDLQQDQNQLVWLIDFDFHLATLTPIVLYDLYKGHSVLHRKASLFLFIWVE